MVLKCTGCWQVESACICSRVGTASVKDSFFVLVELPHGEPTPPKSIARRLHDTKVLENNQRLKNLEDMDKEADEKKNQNKSR